MSVIANMNIMRRQPWCMEYFRDPFVWHRDDILLWSEMMRCMTLVSSLYWPRYKICMFTYYSIKRERKIQEKYADWHVLEFWPLLYLLFHLLLWAIKSRKIRWTRHVARMWEGWGAYIVLMGRSERRKPLWRPRHEWEKKYWNESACSGMKRQGLDCCGWGWVQMASACGCGN